MYWVKLISWLLIFIVLLSLWAFYIALHPFKTHTVETPEQYRIPFEAVSFKTKDNVLIKGWFIPNKNKNAKTIILLHGYPADKGNIFPALMFLHEKYQLLLIDFRYMGESGGSYSTIALNEVEDLKAAIAFLKTKHIHEVYVFGFSVGGSVALLASPSTPEIKAIIAESPFARLDWMADSYYAIPGVNYIIGKLFRLWGWLFLHVDLEKVQPAAILSNIKIPVLLLYSKDDRVVPYKHALLMEKMAAQNPNVQVLITEDKAHGELIGVYRSLISSFFDKAGHDDAVSRK